MPRRHGPEAIGAREQREADEISRKALNPVNRAAVGTSSRPPTNSSRQANANSTRFWLKMNQTSSWGRLGQNLWAPTEPCVRTVFRRRCYQMMTADQFVKLQLLSRSDDSKLVRIPPRTC
jgi:hypothetical protein